jgi:6-phosphogluconolactonase
MHAIHWFKPFFLFTMVFFFLRCERTARNENSSEVMETLFVGTYTEDSASLGIYSGQADSQSGGIGTLSINVEQIHPSFLYLTKDGRFLYAVSELLGEAEGSGFVYAYSIGEDKKLTLINKVRSGGLAPCHLAMNASESFLFVSNYSGGNARVLQVESDGALSVLDEVNFNRDPERHSHAHSATVSPDGRFVYFADLGLDRIWIYPLDSSGLAKHQEHFVLLDSGAGPRHFAFHPTLPFAYVINELNSTVVVFEYDSITGNLSPRQELSTLPPNFSGQSYCADIHVHPSGKFLYGSNRGHNSIVVFSIADGGVRLSIMQHQSTGGNWPRNFVIDPSGNFLYVANQKSDNITNFRIDPETGALTKGDVDIEINKPVFLGFLPRN